MTGGNNVAQVIAPSPNVTGGAWRAPLGTALPTDTTTALAGAFASLGYVGDDGLTRSEQRPQSKQYAWGGTLVASLQQSYSVTHKFKLIQVTDADVLKAVHSDGNVTVAAPTSTVGTLTTTNFNATLNINGVWVFEGFFQATTVRIALPIARVTEVGDLLWSNKQIAAYPITLEAFPDASGNFAYEITDDGIHS